MVGQGRDAGLVESWIGLSGFSESFIRVSITAVIEEKGGRKSYWALAHPPGRPDFHHADGGSQHEENYSVEGCTLLAVLTTDDPLVAFAMA